MNNFYGGYKGRDFKFKAIYPNHATMLSNQQEINLGEFCLINYWYNPETQSEVYENEIFDQNAQTDNYNYHNTLWMRVNGGYRRILSFDSLGAILTSEDYNELNLLQLIIDGGSIN